MTSLIWKASGKQEPFDPAKFTRSLQKAGADPDTIQALIDHIKQAPELRTTKDIYTYAYNYLKTVNRPLAARYNIKAALYQLGPAGYTFEKFAAHFFMEKQYQVTVDQIITGKCVDHEVDIVAKSNTHSLLVECKFHHEAGIKTDVKVALYVNARFEDIMAVPQSTKFQAIWLVTNTKFTTQAIQYATCTGIQLLGWSYPEKNNIADLIDSYRLYPVTALTSLNKMQKKQLISQGILLAKDLKHREQELKSFGLDKNQAHIALEEAAIISAP